MTKMTVTEALAQVKILASRCANKRLKLMEYIARPENMVDPLEKQGGSSAYIKQELQSIDDLERRMILIRDAVHKSNLETTVHVGSAIMTVTQWLTWRREVEAPRSNFMAGVFSAITTPRKSASKDAPKWVVNFDEKQLMLDIENHNTTRDELDTRLSFTNATTTIDI